MDTKIIQLGDEGQRATRDMARRLEALLERHPQIEAPPLRAHFRTLESIDRQYGGEGPLPLEDVETLVAATVTALAYLEQDVRHAHLDDAHEEVADLTVAAALWAIRHGVRLTVVEPVANALAVRANGARTPAQLSAVFGLMQGVIAHVKPQLAPDLERSNPERPWRILHANLAITAIRTEDAALMDAAFDSLDEALPDERGTFYAEALSLALGPRVAPTVRERIETRHAKWNGVRRMP